MATGPEARDLALRTAQLTAIVNTDMLNVRTEPSTESSIWTQISKEERYHVLDQLDGWVQIELDAGDGEGEEVDKAYISTRDNNVEVRYALPEAIKFSPLEERANQQASLRSKVVNYGLKFVGGRYVWGGTNPNTGADCSGFVQYVMRNAAGVSLPRTSREQAKVGRSIKSSEMLPGDLDFLCQQRRHSQSRCHVYWKRSDCSCSQQKERNQDFYLELPESKDNPARFKLSNE